MSVRTAEASHVSKTKSGNIIYWLVSKEDGAENFEMRQISIPPNGQTSKGAHTHEHEVYVLKGKGSVLIGEETSELVPGKAVFIKGNIIHQFINASKTDSLDFICVIPAGAEDENK